MFKRTSGETTEELLKSELDEYIDYKYAEKLLSLNRRNVSSKCKSKIRPWDQTLTQLSINCFKS